MNHIVPVITTERHPQWPYSKAIEKGTTLFAILHDDHYFKWVYTDLRAAERIVGRIQCDYNRSNWVPRLCDCMPTDIPKAYVGHADKRKLYDWEESPGWAPEAFGRSWLTTQPHEKEMG